METFYMQGDDKRLYFKNISRIPDEEELPVIETKEVTFKIEEYEDKRIIKVKACKNIIEELPKDDEEK